MRLELHMQMDSAAFDNGPGPIEAPRILREAADRLESGAWEVEYPSRLLDANGNRVGFFVVTESEPT